MKIIEILPHERQGWLYSTQSVPRLLLVTRACFLALAQNKLRPCSANHRPGYLCNLPCNWPSIAWAYSNKRQKTGPGDSRSQGISSHDIDPVLLTYWNILVTASEELKALNPLRAKFFRGNIKIYLHFVSYLHIDTMQIIEILPQIRQEPTYSTLSISWLLISWWRKEPGHQQPWYWPS